MPASLADRIQHLLGQREHHAAALADIEQKLEQINGILGIGRPGRKPKSLTMPTNAGVETAAVPAKRRRRRRRRFEVTGEQSVLNFIKERKSPTTKEINANWKAEGRGGSADSLLGKLVKERRLKRKPLGGKLGSEYSLA